MTSSSTKGDEGGALPPAEDRAVVNGAGQAVSALRASVPSANAFRLLADRAIHGTMYAHKGALVFSISGWDYGCANGDTRHLGVEHVSVTLNPDGDYPFFTIPKRDLLPISREEAAQGIEAGTDETATQARPEGQEPGSQSECVQTPPESPHHDK